MARYLEEEVLLGICNGTKISRANTVQYKTMDTSWGIHGAFYKPFDISGNDILWDKYVFHTRFNFFAFIEFTNDLVHPVWRNCNGKKQRPYFIKNIILISSLTNCA